MGRSARVYDPWVAEPGFRMDEPALERTLAMVGAAGWIARLACRAFASASPVGARRVRASTVDTPARLGIARASRGWREPRNLMIWAATNGHTELLLAVRPLGSLGRWTAYAAGVAAHSGHARAATCIRRGRG
jgi:hypothetical protein